MADGTTPTATTASAHALDGVTFFASGSNHAGEIHALSLVDGANVGVVAAAVGKRKHPAAWSELVRFRSTGRKVFVDSGAFSEVAFNVPPKKSRKGVAGDGALPRPGLPLGAPFVKKPLDERYWRAVLRVYREIAEAHGPNAYVVAPDCVAHQAETLRRLELYADDVREVRALGATVLVPVQKAPPTVPGALTMAGFWARALDILGDGAWVPAIPMKKDATRLSELYAFVQEVRPEAVHLLGVAPDTDKGREAIETVLAVVPDCRVSCDACLIMRWVGEKNGAGGGPRALTRHNHRFAEVLDIADGDAEVDANEVHLRKLASMFHAARDYWTGLGLAEITALAVELPEDVAADCREQPWLTRFVSAVYAQDGGEGDGRSKGPRARPSPLDCLSVATYLMATPLNVAGVDADGTWRRA